MPSESRTRTLLLLRHAKSSWDDPSLDDFDRPLAARGRRDAPRMGELLRDRGWHPDAVLCSPSQRTRETWAAVADRTPAPGDVTFPETLYHASPAVLLDLVRQLPDGVSTALVVGHNPGMAEAVRMLATGAGADVSDHRADELRRLRKKVPTAALAVFEVVGSWKDLEPAAVRFQRFVRPKDL